LAVYNNKCILCSARVGSENYRDHKIIENLLLCHYFKNVRRQTKMTHKQGVGRFESRSYWTCCWQVASTSTACVHAGRRHSLHMP